MLFPLLQYNTCVIFWQRYGDCVKNYVTGYKKIILSKLF